MVLSLLSLFKAPPISLVVKISILIIMLLVDHSTCMAQVQTRNNLAFIEVTFQNNQMSVDLIEARLVDVLHLAGKQAGFKTHLSGDLTERLTLTFTNLPVEKGLKRLTGKHSLSVLYREAQSSTQPSQDGEKEISEIWVISRNGKSTTATALAEQSRETPEDSGEIDSPQEADQGQPELDDDSSDLQQALDDLVARGDAAAVMAAAAFLRHENEEYRRMVIEGLGTVQGGGSTQALGRALSDEPEAEIRMLALRALAERLEDPEAQKSISYALDDPDQEIQAMADQILSQ